MKVAITKQTSLWPYGHLLQWSITDASVSGVYKVSVYRSGSIEGPWELLAKDLTNVFAFKDTFPQNEGTAAPIEIRPNQLGVFRNFYYKVEVTDASGNVASVAEEVGPNARRPMSGYRRKLRRDFSLQLRKFNGTEIVLLKRRRWGTRCPRCFDVPTKEVMRASCTLCWGTGFVDGYWLPVKTFGRRAVSQNASAITPEQVSDSNDTKVWIPDIVTLEKDDVIVFLEDQRRYRVDVQTQTEMQLEMVHQVVSVQEIPHDNVIYRLKVSDHVNPLF